MKKIMAILLTLIYFSGVMPWVSAEDVQSEETVDVEARDAILTDDKVETIFSLGIMEKNSDDNMFLEGSVSRIDFAEWIFKIMNFEQKDTITEASEQYFDDISLYHYGSGYIQYLASKGIISGYGDKTFRPEEKITYEEASIIIVKAVGHGMYAELTSKNHFAYAKDIGVFEGMGVNKDDEVTRGDVARMLYNMMFVKVPGLATSTETIGSMQNGDEFIRGVMGLDYVDGVIDAIGGVSLYDKEVSVNTVSIDGTEYDTECDFDDMHLGYRVRAYIEPDNYDNLIYYAVRKTEVLELWSDDIVSYSENVYKYLSENDKSKKATIEDDFDFVYNKYYSHDTSKLIPEYGTLKLIDNDRNGKYDVVIVTELRSYVVDKVIAGTEIVFKNKDSENKNITINLADYDDIAIYDVNGNETKTSAIRTDIVLTVTGNDKGMIDIYMSDKTVTGMVMASDTEDDTRYVVIDENEYELIDNCFCGSWNGNIGVEVVLRFDRYGKVASLEYVYTSGWQYGYIIKVTRIDDETGEYVQLKMLTENGIIEKININEKCKIDGKAEKTAEGQENVILEAYNNFVMENPSADAHKKERATTHLVRYCTDSAGNISKIDTPIQQSVFDSKSRSSNADDSFMIRCKGNMYYAPQQKQLKAAYRNYLDIEGEIYTKSSTKFFVIPEEDNENPNDEDYRVTNMQGVGYNVNGEFAYASGYNSDPENLMCDVVVVRKGQGVSGSSNLLIVDKVYSTLDEDDEVRTVVSGYTGGIKDYLVKEISESIAGKLNEGDVILYSLANGEIKIEEIIYSINGNNGVLNNKNGYTPNSTSTTGEATYFNAKFRVVKGIPVRTSGEYIYLDFQTPQTDNDPGMINELLNISSVSVYDASGEEKFYNATATQIRTKEIFGNSADIVILCTKNAQNVSAIAIRK